MRSLSLFALLFILGCGSGSSSSAPTMVFLGDSLTAGSSKSPGIVTFPNLIPGIVAVNRGRSGDTSAQMLARIQECFVPNLKTIVFEGGLNDLAQGVPTADYRNHVLAIIKECHLRHVAVILCTVPSTVAGNPDAYNGVLRALAAEYRCQVADISSAQIGPDGEHPTQEGQALIAAIIAPML